MKMNCSYCAHDNVKGAKFCTACGTNLSFLHRMAAVEGSDRISFWGGERRYVTVLFAKLLGIDTLLLRTPAPEVFIFVRNWCEELEEIVFRFSGISDTIFTEARTLGIFGAPKTHMDDPANAVQSALKIRERWETMKGVPENTYLRIGISSGLVFFGKIQSEISPFTVIGDTVNIASRVEEIAAPNQILISERTYSHLKGLFDAELIPSQRIRGREGLIEIFEVRGVREKPEAKEPEEVPLIGRDKEMSQIKAAVESLMARGSKLLSVAGEIGTGKTKIKEELKRWIASKRNIQYFEADCVSLGHQVPYHSFVRFLKNFFYIAETDTPKAAFEKVERRVKGLWLEQENALPILAHLLSIESAEPGGPAVKNQDSMTEQIYAVIMNLLNKSAHSSALVVCFEDFHLIDPASSKLLTYLATELAERPILFLLLHHPEYGLKVKSPNQESIRLAGLTPNAIVDYVKSILKTDFLNEELINFITYSTGGNPLLIRELIKYCRHQRAIHQEDSVWYFDKTKIEKFVPHSIYEALMSGLDTLPEKVRLIIDCASVVGQAFNHRVLVGIAELGDIGGELGELIEMGYFQLSKSGDDPEYVFRNTLMKDVTYNTLPLKKRKELHAKVGKLIENYYKDRIGEFYEQLAYQFFRADEFHHALDYFKLAGDKAKTLYASDSAVFCYDKVKEIVDLVGLRDEKYHELRLDTALCLCDVYELMSEYDKMLVEAKGGLELLGRGKAARRESLFLERFGLSYIYLGRLKDAFESLNSALEINKVNNYRDLLTITYADLGLLNAKEQNYEMAIYYYNLGYNIALEGEDMKGTMKCLINLALLHKELGNYQLALDYLKNALAFAVGHKSKRDEVLVKNHLGELYAALGDTNKAGRWFKEAFELASEISFIEMIIVASANTSQLNIVRDNREQLRHWLSFIEIKEVLGLSKETERRVELTKVYVVLALGWEDEAKEKAGALIEKCRAFADKKNELLANLLLASVDKKGIGFARNALVLAEQVSIPEFLWRSQYAIGKALLENNQSDSAFDFFRRAYFVMNDLKERLREDSLRETFTSQVEYQYLAGILEEK